MSSIVPTVEEVESLQEWATQERLPFFKMALKYCVPGAAVLDIGCGEGDFARLVLNCDLHLVDGNADSVAAMRTEFANVYEHRVPAPLPFEGERFDVVHCSHLVEHLQPSELYQLLIEVDRCLRRDGVFVVSAPLLWSGFYNDLSHVRPYPPEVFVKYMVSGGKNMTRNAIAGSYAVEKLQYRYATRPVEYYNVSSSRQWVKRLVVRIVNRLRAMRCARYEASGFTLVLRKCK